jgi:hypothetical protein
MIWYIGLYGSMGLVRVNMELEWGRLNIWMKSWEWALLMSWRLSNGTVSGFPRREGKMLIRWD